MQQELSPSASIRPCSESNRPHKRQRHGGPTVSDLIHRDEQRKREETVRKLFLDEASTPTHKHSTTHSVLPRTVHTFEDDSSVTSREAEEGEDEECNESVSVLSDAESEVDSPCNRNGVESQALLNDYLRQTSLSEHKEHIILNVRDTKFREVYFSGPEEVYGVREAHPLKLYQKGFLGSELLLEIRSQRSDPSHSLEPLLTRHLANEAGYFLVWELCSLIIACARQAPGCGPQLKNLEMATTNRGSLPVLVAEFGYL